ncbi:MAG: VTT domain-containing protein [Chloroflexota bacterium]
MTNQPLPPSPSDTTAPRHRALLRPLIIGTAFLIINIIVYLLPIDYSIFGNYAYGGVFLITLIANATVVIPIPYIPVVARIAAEVDSVALVILLSALGSALGESVAFWVGRSGKGVVEETRFYTWVQRQLQHPWRAFLLLFALAAPPNPVFDIAGLSAGALGLPYWMFFTAVFLGRTIRMGLISVAGIQLDG